MIKKVLEQDEPAGRCMVLCLAAVLDTPPGGMPPLINMDLLLVLTMLPCSTRMLSKASTG